MNFNSDPVLNDPNEPLVSIFVYNYEGSYLRQCLNSIFCQDILKNFEVILVDDATNDGSWDTVMDFLNNYPKRITVNRNRKVMGPHHNFRNCMQMAKGRYCVPLNCSQVFMPEYVKNTVNTMNLDPYTKSSVVCRVTEINEIAPPGVGSFEPLPSILSSPLVSILCYNYNYGRYLRQCLESVFAQTYENIELCFSDNASTDESWAIAVEFAEKYPGKMCLTRNRMNFGPDANFANCRRNKQGKYYINFCSDDVLDPEFVERCVDALETYPNAGLALVNRAIIDEHGRRTEEPPFYNQSCIIPGEEQAAVYMMAGVNPSVSQIMYRCAIVDTRTVTGGLVARYYGTRILDFNISTDFDIAYIKEPLLVHRIHSESDTSQADSNLLPIIGLYVLNHQFADIASVRNLSKVIERLPKSVEKLAHLSVRYSVRSLIFNDEQSSLRYFHLAVAMHPKIVEDLMWIKLHEYFESDALVKLSIIELLRSSDNVAARSISYDPPAGSIPISPKQA